VPEFRPRFAEWPTITEIVQEWGTRMMLGEVSVEEGARTIGERMEAVLEEAGYYDGRQAPRPVDADADTRPAGRAPPGPPVWRGEPAAARAP
jgi:hypothetical protein